MSMSQGSPGQGAPFYCVYSHCYLEKSVLIHALIASTRRWVFTVELDNIEMACGRLCSGMSHCLEIDTAILIEDAGSQLIEVRVTEHTDALTRWWTRTRTGLRLADKRSLPCPRRLEWLAARDDLYEEIMHKAWNKDLQVFGQSYEETDVLDSSVLIMPLVFFMTPVCLNPYTCLFREC